MCIIQPLIDSILHKEWVVLVEYCIPPLLIGIPISYKTKRSPAENYTTFSLQSTPLLIDSTFRYR